MITLDMNILDILNLNPDMEKVFLAHGLDCFGCPGSQVESLREAADGHGVDPESLLSELSKCLAETK